ncbi:MAG: peptidylprolyl isomerase, partial [Alphaproteobacteria bacterium]
FGPDFARALEEVPPGRWSGPIASSSGWHVVLVDEREPATLPPLESVRGRVQESWREARRAERLAAFVAGLRARQPLEVESKAWRERPRP